MPASVGNVNSTALADATQSPEPSQVTQSGALVDSLSVGQTKLQDLGIYNQAGVAQSNVPGTRNFLSGSGPVVVDILNSDSGYENKIYWSSDNFATRHYLGVDNKTGSYNLGSFAAGTKIDFGVENGVNQFFRTGQASANFDNFEHAKAEVTSDGLQIGFEDLAGGGDKDFNDAIIRIRTTPTPANPPAAAAGTAPSNPTPAPGTVLDSLNQLKDNRSGLGDGTNPGQGAGTVNSPNQGTNNPGTANKAAQTQAQTQAQVQSRPQTAAEKKAAEAKAQADAQAIATAKKTAEAKAKTEAQAQAAAAAKKIADAKAKAEAQAQAQAAATAKKTADAKAKAEAQAKAQAAAAAKKIADAKAKAEAQAQAQAAAAKKAAEAKAKAEAQVQAQAQTILAAAKKAHDNRSGLGDGTNPGQGAGTVNSPNQGTNNPGTTGASGKK